MSCFLHQPQLLPHPSEIHESSGLVVMAPDVKGLYVVEKLCVSVTSATS